jgi:beta-N-acetylhexosaminidase
MLLSSVQPYHIYAQPVSNTQVVSRQVQSLLDSMTLEQRVGQLFMVSLYGEGLNEQGVQFLRQMNPGAVAYFSYNGTTPAAATNSVNTWQTVVTGSGAQIPLIVAVDQEGGTVRRLTDGFTSLPWGGALVAMPPEDAHEVGQLAGAELSAVGINMNLAPVVDVRTVPNAFMEKRSMGGDPLAIGSAAAAYIDGMRNNGVIGVLKHFPGHGSAGDSHNLLPVVNYDLNHINSVELVPFKEAIAGGAEAIMVGHLVYPSLDPTPGLPASLSPKIINDVLRKQLGFNGLVISDAMDMAAIVNNFTRPVAAVMAIKAGIDMIAAGPHSPLSEQIAMKQAVIDAVNSGDIPQSRIDEAVLRVLAVKERYHLLAWQPLDVNTASTQVNVEDHTIAVDRLMRDAVSVVHNDQGLLPLTAGSQKVAIIYPGAFTSIMRECVAIDIKATSLAYTLHPSKLELASTHSISRVADVTIVFTYNMPDYPAQADLVSSIASPKVVLVALESPYDNEQVEENPAAYVTTFNAIPAAFKAVCAVLYGKSPAKGTWKR